MPVDPQQIDQPELPEPVYVPPKRRMGTGTVVVLVAVGVCAISGIIGAIVSLGGSDEPATTQPAVRSTVAADALNFLRATYQGTSKAGYLDLVTGVDDANSTLTVHTKLAADAQEPALSMCRVLATHTVDWPIRILDGTDSILVSRRGAGQPCEWRR